MPSLAIAFSSAAALRASASLASIPSVLPPFCYELPTLGFEHFDLGFRLGDVGGQAGPELA